MSDTIYNYHEVMLERAPYYHFTLEEMELDLISRRNGWDGKMCFIANGTNMEVKF